MARSSVCAPQILNLLSITFKLYLDILPYSIQIVNPRLLQWHKFTLLVRVQPHRSAHRYQAMQFGNCFPDHGIDFWIEAPFLWVEEAILGMWAFPLNPHLLADQVPCIDVFVNWIYNGLQCVARLSFENVNQLWQCLFLFWIQHGSQGLSIFWAWLNAHPGCECPLLRNEQSQFMLLLCC